MDHQVQGAAEGFFMFEHKTHPQLFGSCLPDDLWTHAGLWTMIGHSQTTIQFKNKIHKAIYESFGKLYVSPSGGNMNCSVLHTSLSLPFSVCLIVTKMSPPVSHSAKLLEKVTVTTVCWCFWCNAVSDADCSLLSISCNGNIAEENDKHFLFTPNYTDMLPNKQLGGHVCTCFHIANIHISVGLARKIGALCTSLFPPGYPAVLIWLVVIPARSFMQTLSSSLPCLTYLPISLSLPPSLPVSPLLSIPSLACPFIRKWYIGGFPLCHAQCLWAALRSVSPLSNSTD